MTNLLGVEADGNLVLVPVKHLSGGTAGVPLPLTEVSRLLDQLAGITHADDAPREAAATAAVTQLANRIAAVEAVVSAIGVRLASVELKLDQLARVAT
jgi:hypothetical protein